MQIHPEHKLIYKKLDFSLGKLTPLTNAVDLTHELNNDTVTSVTITNQETQVHREVQDTTPARINDQISSSTTDEPPPHQIEDLVATSPIQSHTISEEKEDAIEELKNLPVITAEQKAELTKKWLGKYNNQPPELIPKLKKTNFKALRKPIAEIIQRKFIPLMKKAMVQTELETDRLFFEGAVLKISHQMAKTARRILKLPPRPYSTNKRQQKEQAEDQVFRFSSDLSKRHLSKVTALILSHVQTRRNTDLPE